MTDKQIIIDKLKNDITCKENIINHLADTNIDLQKQLKAKEQECERLRFPMQNTNYAILAKEEFEEYKKLKQTLTEIKEIAKIRKDDINDWLAKEILQKISEVEDETINN